jgi:hypothetical protein
VSIAADDTTSVKEAIITIVIIAVATVAIAIIA